MEKQPELTVDLKKLWNETLALVPQQIIEPATKAAMKKEWLKLERRFGLPRFKAAVEEARMHTNWFPTAKEIQEHVPESDAFLRITTNDGCEFCGGSGWKDTGGAKLLETMGRTRRVTRCHCRKTDFVRSA
jgi:hypothetical protein